MSPQEIETLKQQFAQNMRSRMLPTFSDTGREASPMDVIQSYTSAPLKRVLMSKLSGEQIPASFGSDPETAPSGQDIARQLGVSDNPINPVQMDNYSTVPLATASLLSKIGRSKLLGTGIDLASDPTTYLPGEALGKLAGPVGEVKNVKGLITGVPFGEAPEKTALEKLNQEALPNKVIQSDYLVPDEYAIKMPRKKADRPLEEHPKAYRTVFTDKPSLEKFLGPAEDVSQPEIKAPLDEKLQVKEVPIASPKKTSSARKKLIENIDFNTKPEKSALENYEYSLAPKGDISSLAKKRAAASFGDKSYRETIKLHPSFRNMAEDQSIGEDNLAMLEQIARRHDDPYDASAQLAKVQADDIGPYNVVDGLKFPVPNYGALPTGKIGEPKIGDMTNTKGIYQEQIPWMDDKYKAAKQLLFRHKSTGTPLEIHTSNDLIARPDYMEAMDPKNTIINMHTVLPADYSGPAGRINRQLFPGTPSYQRQIGAFHKLTKEGGFNVNLIEGTPEKVWDQLGQKTINKRLGTGFGSKKEFVDYVNSKLAYEND